MMSLLLELTVVRICSTRSFDDSEVRTGCVSTSPRLFVFASVISIIVTRLSHNITDVIYVYLLVVGSHYNNPVAVILLILFASSSSVIYFMLYCPIYDCYLSGHPIYKSKNTLFACARTLRVSEYCRTRRGICAQLASGFLYS